MLLLAAITTKPGLGIAGLENLAAYHTRHLAILPQFAQFSAWI